MRGEDIEYRADATYEYECLSCGDRVSADSYPGECPNCGASYRNRNMPLE